MTSGNQPRKNWITSCYKGGSNGVSEDYKPGNPNGWLPTLYMMPTFMLQEMFKIKFLKNISLVVQMGAVYFVQDANLHVILLSEIPEVCCRRPLFAVYQSPVQTVIIPRLYLSLISNFCINLPMQAGDMSIPIFD